VSPREHKHQVCKTDNKNTIDLYMLLYNMTLSHDIYTPKTNYYPNETEILLRIITFLKS